MKKLILASKSPRRIELIKTMGIPYEVMIAEVDESFKNTLTPEENVVATAYKKAKAVYNTLQDKKDIIVLGVDTIVVYDDKILGKPKDQNDAYRMIKTLSGKTHEVFSGVALIGEGETVRFCERSLVEFIALSEDEIQAYIDTAEPYDKAGAYGIQGTAGLFVKSIWGCYYNIMGLPLSSIYRALRDRFGFAFDWDRIL